MYPLVKTGGDEKAAVGVDEPVEDCAVSLNLDPHVCSVRLTEQKGRPLRERDEAFWFKIRILSTILAIVLAIGCYYLYAYLQNQWTVAAHIAWLKDFYQTHAPEVKRIDIY